MDRSQHGRRSHFACALTELAPPCPLVASLISWMAGGPFAPLDSLNAFGLRTFPQGSSLISCGAATCPLGRLLARRLTHHLSGCHQKSPLVCMYSLSAYIPAVGPHVSTSGQRHAACQMQRAHSCTRARAPEGLAAAHSTPCAFHTLVPDVMLRPQRIRLQSCLLACPENPGMLLHGVLLRATHGVHGR